MKACKFIPKQYLSLFSSFDDLPIRYDGRVKPLRFMPRS